MSDSNWTPPPPGALDWIVLGGIFTFFLWAVS